MPIWIPPLILFAASAVAFLGALITSRERHKEMAARIGLIAPALSEEAGAALSISLLHRGATWLRGALIDLFAIGMRRRWGTHPHVTLLLAAAGFAALMAGMLASGILGLSPGFSFAFALFAFVFVPHVWLQQQQSRAEKQFVDAFPGAIDMVIHMLRAGLPFVAAIRGVGREAPSPVNRVFVMLTGQLEIGIPLEEALDSVGAKIGLPDFRFFGVAVALQSITGGNLVSTLEILADIMRKRRAIRLKARAATTEVRFSAYVLGALPVFVIVILVLVQPAYLAPLLNDPRGNVILGMASASLFIAFAIMRHMMRGVTKFETPT